MKKTMIRVWKKIALLDGVLVLISLWVSSAWLINTQVAFASSALITFATFFSYKRMVERRVEAGAFGEEKDVLKKYEDPYDLYDEDEPNESPPHEVPAMQESPKIGFKESFKNLVNSYKGALSPYRLGAYGVLFVSVLSLMRHDLLEPIPFFLGLSIVPLGSLFLGNKGF
jgi:hypothetical protein